LKAGHFLVSSDKKVTKEASPRTPMLGADSGGNIKSRNGTLERSLSLFVIPAQAGIQFC
jgi:hypothetical protein